MKLIAQRGILKHFLVFFWKYNLLFVVGSRTQFTNVRVGVFLDQRSHVETLPLEKYGATIDDHDRNSSRLSRISLQIKTIFLDGQSLEDISRTFCSSVLESNVTVIILQTGHENLQRRFIVNLASYFKIPVIESLSQEPLLPEKVRKIEIILIYPFKFGSC